MRKICMFYQIAAVTISNNDVYIENTLTYDRYRELRDISLKDHHSNCENSMFFKELYKNFIQNPISDNKELDNSKLDSK